jgi:hypothetical protein
MTRSRGLLIFVAVLVAAFAWHVNARGAMAEASASSWKLSRSAPRVPGARARREMLRYGVPGDHGAVALLVLRGAGRIALGVDRVVAALVGGAGLDSGSRPGENLRHR